jgi:hypothetical protein
MNIQLEGHKGMMQSQIGYRQSLVFTAINFVTQVSCAGILIIAVYVGMNAPVSSLHESVMHTFPSLQLQTVTAPMKGLQRS